MHCEEKEHTFHYQMSTFNEILFFRTNILYLREQRPEWNFKRNYSLMKMMKMYWGWYFFLDCFLFDQFCFSCVGSGKFHNTYFSYYLSTCACLLVLNGQFWWQMIFVLSVWDRFGYVEQRGKKDEKTQKRIPKPFHCVYCNSVRFWKLQNSSRYFVSTNCEKKNKWNKTIHNFGEQNLIKSFLFFLTEPHPLQKKVFTVVTLLKKKGRETLLTQFYIYFWRCEMFDERCDAHSAQESVVTFFLML